MQIQIRSLLTIINPLILLTIFSNTVSATEIPRIYLIDVPFPTVAPAKAQGKTLLVSTPQAAPGFDTPAMVYKRSPYLLEYYTKSRWIDTPARMILPLIINHLEATGLFKAVLSAVTSPVSGELRLDTEIFRLQQEFLTEPSQVRLILRAQLLNMEKRQVIATKVFEILENSPSEDAEGGVAATHQAIAHLLKELTEFIGKQVN
jgi:cholesterol transport system auxiliary component